MSPCSDILGPARLLWLLLELNGLGAFGSSLGISCVHAGSCKSVPPPALRVVRAENDCDLVRSRTGGSGASQSLCAYNRGCRVLHQSGARGDWHVACLINLVQGHETCVHNPNP
eukprot:357108-Chlamydomonas_euryale.AAC.1